MNQTRSCGGKADSASTFKRGDRFGLNEPAMMNGTDVMEI